MELTASSDLFGTMEKTPQILVVVVVFGWLILQCGKSNFFLFILDIN